MTNNTNLSNKKELAKKPLEKLKSHKAKLEDPTLQDVDKYIALNTELEDPEQVTSLREFLIDNQAIVLEENGENGNDKVSEINPLKLIDKKDSQYRSLLEVELDHTIFRKADSKQELAQEYADWLIEEVNIIPVWINGATIFYRYNHLNHTWNEVDYKMIRKKAKKDLQKDYNKNMRQEIVNQLTDHYNFVEFEDMGLSSHELLLNNGKVLDLKTKNTREVEASDYALNCVNSVYSEDAESNGLKEFIEKTIDEPKMVKTFQEYLGYTLKWPNNDYEKMLLILGNTDTGKSTLLTVVEELFNESNVTKISFPQIGMDRAFHIKDLKDSVLNLDSDMDDQSIKRKSRVKKVVSKEEVFVEPKGESGFSMTPRANFIVTSNDAPDDAGATDAYYNRFLTITATNRVSEEDKDRELVDKLTTEENMKWLLNWAIKGLERLESQNTFTFNPTEYETKKMWDKFGNSIQQFIADQVVVDSEEGYNVKTVDLYEAYELWCETQIESKAARNKFIAQAANHPDLVKRNTMDKHGDQGSCFVDIRVRDYAV